MSATQTVKCQFCGSENEPTAERCAYAGCARSDWNNRTSRRGVPIIKSEIECLRSIDVSLRTIKRIAMWWFILSILAIAAAVILAANRL
jgi:hypothetical protein